MKIIQITPGAGAMFCGNCLRDNALVMALRGMGHEVLMIPLYLPLTLDEADQSANTPIFFSGINVYLEQKSALFRVAPKWLHSLFRGRRILKWAAGRAAKTRAADVGELALSMLQGQHGNQSREIDELCDWLKTQAKPDVVCLSNALLLGMAPQLKEQLKVPVVCTLQGEDTFLDALSEPYRTRCWKSISDLASGIDRFVAPSRYFGELMKKRLALNESQVRIVYNGINLSAYNGLQNSVPAPTVATEATAPLTLGFFTRMCREKGLDILVEAYIKLRQKGRIQELKLKVGGSCGPSDQPLVDALQARLASLGYGADVTFLPNPDHAAKVSFLGSLSVFSVPAAYGEAFGLYVIEAMAAGVPVVQPRTAAFAELIELTGGGLLCAPNDTQSLAETLEALLLDPKRARSLGEAGREAVFKKFNAQAMAKAMLAVYDEALGSLTEKARELYRAP